MNNKVAMGAGVAVLLIAAFFGGYKYATAKSPSAVARGGMSQAYGAQGGMRGARFAAGGAAFGQIVSKDDKSITISVQGGGSRIVFLSASTTISKMVAGSASDLAVGQNVVVAGTPNSDGSMTASSIDLRPAAQVSK